MRSPSDNSAWENFLRNQKRIIVGIVYRIAGRFGVNSVDGIDDAVQEVCLKISSPASLAKMPDDGDMALETYAKALIANAAHDHFRGQRAKRRDVLAAISLDSELRDTNQSTSNLESEILIRELQSLADTDERGRQVFQLYYRCGWTAKEIASIPELGLSTKGVESLVCRLTSDLRERLKLGAKGMQAEKGKHYRPS